MRLEWFIARRYLSSSHGLRLLSLIPLIATAGIVVGVTALVVVTAVMNGLQDHLRSQILGASPPISLTLRDETVGMTGWEEVLRRVRRMGEVEAAAPFVKAEVLAANRANYMEGAILRGVEPGASAPFVNETARRIHDGELKLGPTRSGHPPLLVGASLASRLGIVPGDLVTLVSPAGMARSPVGGFMPRLRYFEMTGTFETGIFAFDDRHLYTTLAAGQDIAGLGAAVSGIELGTRDPMRDGQVAREIETALGPDYRATDWQSANSSLFSALKLEKVAMAVILLLIVLVASFGIVSLLAMLVDEKRREIGILRSMGLRSEQVRRVFMLQGVVIGVLGSALGGAAGLLISWILDRYPIIHLSDNAFALDRLPVAFHGVDIGVILVTSLVISFLATLYPAQRAAQLLPVESIRGG